MGVMKGVGRIYQQTFIDTYSKVGFAKLYDRKTPICAAELLNDRVIPFFDEHEVLLLRILTDRGTEYCGNPERHELYLAVENIDHSRTKTKSPPTNGIAERLHKTVLNEFYRVAFRKRPRSRSCSATWMSGCRSTTRCAHIRAGGATERRRWRPSLTPPMWRATNSCLRTDSCHASDNPPDRTGNEVRQSLSFYSFPARYVLVSLDRPG